MLKVKAKLVSKYDESPLDEEIIVDVPKEYTNRQMIDYLEKVLFEIVKGKTTVKFEVVG